MGPLMSDLECADSRHRHVVGLQWRGGTDVHNRRANVDIYKYWTTLAV